MGTFKIIIVSFFSIFCTASFADDNIEKKPSKTRKNNYLLSISEGRCDVDGFGRNICIPPVEISTLYKLRLSKDLTKMSLKGIFSDELIKAQSLINIEDTAKIDVKNVYWVIEEKGLGTKIVVGVLYRETYTLDIRGLEESYNVMRIGLKNTCLVANLLSERFGPEVDLFKAAERLSLNLDSATCL